MLSFSFLPAFNLFQALKTLLSYGEWSSLINLEVGTNSTHLAGVTLRIKLISNGEDPAAIHAPHSLFVSLVTLINCGQ
jgi:hypothetical protein